mgnify:CR=1 FL=1
MDVFGYSLGSFWNSVSGKFSGEDELDCRLNFSGRESSSFVESDKLWTFSSNSIESIMNERVHDVHGFLWDTNVGVHLLKNFVDVDWEGLDSSSSGFLVSFGGFWGSSFFLSHCNYLELLRVALISNLNYYYLLIIILEIWLAKSVVK